MNNRISLALVTMFILIGLLGTACGTAATPVPTEAPAEAVQTATEAPAAEVPATDAPVAEVPATDAPATDVPATDVPPTDVPAVAAPAAVDRPMVVAIKTETITLDPHDCDYGYCQVAQHGAYESLLSYVPSDDGKTTVGPCLASSYQTDDGKVWTLTIQDGIKFTDGTPLDAEAVKYNFDRILGLNKVPANRLPAIEKVEVVDEMTVRITLVNVFSPFSESLTKFYLVSPAAAQEHATNDDPWGSSWLFDHAVGTGPYLIDSWVKGQNITFTKNDDYWRGWEGNHVSKIVLSYVPEASTRRLLLENGEVDLAQDIAFDDLDALSEVPGVVVQGYEQPSLITFRFRQQGVLKDVRVRHAIELAFGYEDFIDGVLLGRASYPRGVVPPVVWVFDDTIPEAKQDMEAAKALLAEAGYPDGGFELTVATIATYGWYQPREAQILQANLKELGITLNIQDYPDAAAYYAAIGTADEGPDIFAWTANYSINDPVSELAVFHSNRLPENGGTNYMRVNDPEIDRLIDAGLAEGSPEKRLTIYKELQQLLVDEHVILATALPLYYMTMRDSVQGFTWMPFLIINGSYEWYDFWLSE